MKREREKGSKKRESAIETGKSSRREVNRERLALAATAALAVLRRRREKREAAVECGGGTM